MVHRQQTAAEKMRDQRYYRSAARASQDIMHPGTTLLISETGKAGKILDLGCGEGTRLANLLRRTSNKGHVKEVIGIDVNPVAIKLARRKYPQLKFVVGTMTHLPFADDYFDLVYSAYVFEHLTQPESAIREAARVVRPNGKIIILAPNFGSPNRRSPNSTQNKVVKLIGGFYRDLWLFFRKSLPGLHWLPVTPLTDRYTQDADTVVEPYLNSLLKFGHFLGLKTDFSSSFWSVDRFSIFQFPFRIFGWLGIYPFNLWGPHLGIVFRK
jgi:ubiquinone/menaquinone biosynthesis C-methylase UbiE